MHGTGDSFSRRDWLALLGAAGAGAVLPPGVSQAAPPGRPDAVPILPLTSTSEVYTPSHRRAFMRFRFEFPAPSIEFEGYRFGFLVFTRENAYGLDARRMTAERTADGHGMAIHCAGLVWAGGQQAAPGRVTAQLQKRGDFIEWDVTAELGQPIKAVTTVIRNVPRGRISPAGNEPFDPRDNEVLFGYPFGGGDLFGANTAWGRATPRTGCAASRSWSRSTACITPATCSTTTRTCSRSRGGSRPVSRRSACCCSSRRGTAATTGTIRCTGLPTGWAARPGCSASSRKHMAWASA